MRPEINQLIEPYRTRHPKLGLGQGNDGLFMIPGDEVLACISSSGAGCPVGEVWEHVSVSKESGECPTWEEMCRVKDLFFHPEEVVIQIHPRASEYVNFHQGCLHLWKPLSEPLPEPPSILVGPTDQQRRKSKRRRFLKRRLNS